MRRPSVCSDLPASSPECANTTCLSPLAPNPQNYRAASSRTGNPDQAPAELLERWEMQIETPYDDLTERERDNEKAQLF